MTAYLFDIDGVLTNPHTTNEVNPQFIPLLVTKLNEGDPIALISGRPLSWEITEIVEKLERYVMEHTVFDPAILDNLFVSGEFGSTRAIHSNGERKEMIDNERAFPKELIQKLQEVMKQFEDYAAIDTAKLTMFTVYADGRVPLQVFKEHKDEIFSAIQKVVGGNPEIEVHEDQVSINVKHKLANKHDSTEQFLTWLAEKEKMPSHFYAFGDSESDLDIGKALYTSRLPFTYIFVGKKENIAHAVSPFPITFTTKQFDEGTLEFFSEMPR